MSAPNLFGFATSELSQDAVLCWLIAWADPAYADRDAAVHAAGRRLLEALLGKCGHDLPRGDAPIRVEPQFEHIDIVATIGDSTVLAIEDKTHTVNHSNQLARYRAIVESRFSGRKHAFVYLKTGDQCTYEGVESEGWKVFDRGDLLQTLRPLRKEVSNAIFCDFVDHLETIEAAVRAYATAPADAWDGMAWKGFYIALREALGDGHWGYVANPTGGFMGFWWGFQAVARGEVYLQLEEDKLVIKVAPEDAADRRAFRDTWVARTLERMSSFGFQRPARLGHGSYMTVAVLAEDYRRFADSKLDFEATVAVLREATARVRRLVAEP